MRFVSRILIGVAAATALAVGAPAAANATTATATTTATSASHYYDADWGPYYSSDHKASSEGHVTVDKQAYKFWYWKTYKKHVKFCWFDKQGDKHCKWIWKTYKKKVFVWKYKYFYTVDSTLTNYKWWGHRKFVCAWETFKVVNFDGSSYFKSFKNCSKHPADYSFDGWNAAHIYVDVSRGNYYSPKGYHSGWQDVYHHA
ncbi:hypothetical protein ACIBG8_13310 [Nonomuraea sp. NPDC050556]|uniref:hypothetical protein n=1 Tax=Nonomuraea sp. NPDC050556 TaxID=3364369 RepID=UPI0037899938